MDRFSKITSCLDLAHEAGLEIGPLCWPVVSKDRGEIYYADHLSADDLRAKYSWDSTVDGNRIVPVDFVTGDRSLAEAIGPERRFDYVIASHVIEHVPDPIAFLQDLSKITKVGGHICLAIPDRRYTFDYYRHVSEFSELVEAHLLKRTKASARQVFSFFSLKAVVNVEDAWGSVYDHRPPALEVPLAEAFAWAKEAALGERYLDVHCYVFTPRSFVEILRCCFELGLLDVAVARFWETAFNENEFIVTLKRLPHSDDPQVLKRMQLSSLPAIGAAVEPVPLADWTLVAANSGGFEGRVFVVVGGNRYWVPTVEWATGRGFRWPDDIKWISEDELGRVPYVEGLPEGKPE